MNKIVNYIVLGLGVLTLAASCSKEMPLDKQVRTPNAPNQLVVSLGGSTSGITYAPTEAYGLGQQNPAEIDIQSLYVYLFNSTTSTLQYYCQAETFGNGLAQFPLFTPLTNGSTYQGGSVTAGDNLTAVFVANYQIPSSALTLGTTTLATLQSITLPAVATALPSLFVMYGQCATSVAIAEQGATTLASVTMVRLAARIDITNEIGSDLVINSAQLINAATSSALSAAGTPTTNYATLSPVANTGYNTITGTTNATTHLQYMWGHLYTYANPNVAPATPTQVEVKYTLRGADKVATVDFVDATTNAIIPIDRNHRYQIRITLGELAAPQFSVSVVEWNDYGYDLSGDITADNMFAVSAPAVSAPDTYTPCTDPGCHGGTLSTSGAGTIFTFSYTSPTKVSVMSDAMASEWLAVSHNNLSPTYAATGAHQGEIVVSLEHNLTASRTATFYIKSGAQTYTYTIDQALDAGGIPGTNVESANSFIVAPGTSAIVFEAKRANADGIKTRIGANDRIGAVLLWTDNPNGQADNSAVASLRTYLLGDQTLIEVKPGTAEGNAVVAAYNFTTDQIVWSWHIWVTAYDPETTNKTYTSTSNGLHTFMDRNLGAMSATPGDLMSKGLVYQWGRKDPFFVQRTAWILSPEQPIYRANKTAFTVPIVNVDATGETENNLNYAISHPTNFIAAPGNLNNSDWYALKNGLTYQRNDLWGFTGNVATSTKSIYDPCPKGWRIPLGSVWAGTTNLNMPWSENDHGRSHPDLGYYPCQTYRSGSNGTLSENYGIYWNSTNTTASMQTYIFYFTKTDFNNYTFNNRAQGFPVRCVKE